MLNRTKKHPWQNSTKGKLENWYTTFFTKYSNDVIRQGWECGHAAHYTNVTKKSIHFQQCCAWVKIFGGHMCPPTLTSGGHLQNLGNTQKQYNFKSLNFNLSIVSCPLLFSKVSGLA